MSIRKQADIEIVAFLKEVFIKVPIALAIFWGNTMYTFDSFGKVVSSAPCHGGKQVQ